MEGRKGNVQDTRKCRHPMLRVIDFVVYRMKCEECGKILTPQDLIKLSNDQIEKFLMKSKLGELESHLTRSR